MIFEDVLWLKIFIYTSFRLPDCSLQRVVINTMITDDYGLQLQATVYAYATVNNYNDKLTVA